MNIVDFTFDPETLEVSAGRPVRWLNIDPRPHTLTSGVPGSPDGRFDHETTERSRRFEFTFVEPGIYFYFCRHHPSMRGTVVVK